MDVFNLVATFNHTILGLPCPEELTRMSEERKGWFHTAATEELNEFMAADTIDEEADALGDLIYFAMGRLYEMGIEPSAMFDEIHRANMDKVRGELSKRPGSAGFDAVKPEGWRPPASRLLRVSGKPRLLVIGPGQHGKDTFCDILATNHGYKFTPASRYLAEKVIYPRRMGDYLSADECYQMRDYSRQMWKEMLADYCGGDDAKIGYEIFRVSDIYCGIRRRAEFEALTGIADAVVWVEAPERLGTKDATLELTVEDADYIVENDSSIRALEKATASVALMLEK